MRSAAAVLLLLAAATVRAEEAPAPAQDPIAAAKKDFAAIRSTAVSPDPSSPLPALDLKDVGGAPAAALSAPTPLPSDGETSLDPAKKSKGTGNWLIDAMDKEKNAGRTQPSRPGDERLKPDAELEADADRTETGGAREGASGAEARDAASPKDPADKTYNPLDSFMAGWISARDHDLLVPSSKDGAPAGAEAARLEGPAGPDPMPSGSLVDMLLPPPDSASWGDSKPEANPFLAPSDSEPAPAVKFFTGADAPGFAPFGLTDPVPGAGPSGPSALPADASRTFLPDFAQPSDDDKYFKQMKRF
jgi:hypothetical protein